MATKVRKETKGLLATKVSMAINLQWQQKFQRAKCNSRGFGSNVMCLFYFLQNVET